MKQEAQKRLRDFRTHRRTTQDYKAFKRTGYVAVNPFADDHELLTTMSWSPERCTHVDAYWEVLDDVVFVQMISAASEKARPAGVYVRRSDGLNLVAVVEDKLITRDVFERELDAIMKNETFRKAIRDVESLSRTLIPLLGDSQG